MIYHALEQARTIPVGHRACLVLWQCESGSLQGVEAVVAWLADPEATLCMDDKPF
jgi:hypothetical protein